MDKEYERVFCLLDKVEELEFHETKKKVKLGEKEFVIRMIKDIEQNDEKSFITTTIRIDQKDGTFKMISSKRKEEEKDKIVQTPYYIVREFVSGYEIVTEKRREIIDGPYVLFPGPLIDYWQNVRVYPTEKELKAISVDDYTFYKRGNLMTGYVVGKEYAYDFLDGVYTVDGIDYDVMKDEYAKLEEHFKAANHIYQNVLKKKENIIPLSIFEKIELEKNRIDFGMEKVNLAKENVDRTVDKWTDFSESEVVEFESAVISMIADIKVENMAQNITQQLSSLNEGQRQQVLSKIIVKK